MLLACLYFVLGGWGLAFAVSDMVSPLLLSICGLFIQSITLNLLNGGCVIIFLFLLLLFMFNG
jgi:hypothetical protein